jgi:hypothetical protein
MTYPQSGGFQQQPYQQGGGPGGYGGGYNYPAQSGGNPATAIIAGVLGLAAAVLMAIAGFKMLSDLSDAPDGFEVPTELTIIVVLVLASAAVCLIGAIITFVRKVAGAFVLLIGSIVVIAAILLQPVLLSSASAQGDISFGDYFEVLFKFDSTEYTCMAIALIVAPFVLIFSVIPPTLNWLRGSSAAQSHGGYPQQQQGGGYQGW